jgi:surface protein
MSYLFEGTSAFNQDIGDWNTSSATQMTSILKGANQFDQDISDWNISKVTKADYLL